MKIKSIAPWFGGKRTLAPKIVAQLGKHTQYFEPFCGSMAVLFAKEQCASETANDLHGDLINLARVISDGEFGPKLYDLLGRVVISDQILEEARYWLTADFDFRSRDVNRAYWYFLASWMSRNGIAGLGRQDFQLAVRWTQGGGSPVVRWRSAVESIPEWHKRLLNVIILNRDAFKIIDRFEDAPHTAIYVDPPYMKETRTSGSTNGKYLHDFPGPDVFNLASHHDILREALGEYKHARIVVSYYDCPKVRELYEGWTFIDCAMAKNITAQSTRKETTKIAKAPEVLIVNGEAFPPG